VECFFSLQPLLHNPWGVHWHFNHHYSNRVMFIGTSAIAMQTVWCSLAQLSLCKPCDVPWHFSNCYADRVMFLGTSAIAMQTVWCSSALQPSLCKPCDVPWHLVPNKAALLSNYVARLSATGLHNPRPAATFVNSITI